MGFFVVNGECLSRQNLYVVIMENEKFFILLKDTNATKQKKEYESFYPSTTNVKLFLKGEIVCQKSSTTIDTSKGTLRLHPCDKPNYYFECAFSDIGSLTKEEAKLLLSFTSKDARYKYYSSQSLNDANAMNVGSKVFVKVRSPTGGMQELRGVVRYKGPLPDVIGTMFGVELEDGKGRGTTHGDFKGRKYFRCETECGLFVSLDKLRLRKEEESFLTNFVQGVKNKLFAEKNVSNHEKNVSNHENNVSNHEKNVSNHQVNDRVWVYIEDKPKCGTIRYIGRVPGGDKIYAGVELDQPVGMGHGEYYGQQLFTCYNNHAHFTPLSNIISKKQFQEMYGVKDSLKHQKTVCETTDDILKMESDFAGESTEDVCNQQKEILRQIKNEAKKDKLQSSNEEASVEELQQSQSNHVSNNVNYENAYQVPEGIASVPLQSTFEIGTMVEVLSSHEKPKYGIIRWLGFLPNTEKKVAGLELDEDLTAGSDGTFQGKRYFTCKNGRALFVHLHNCQLDSRFTEKPIKNPANRRLTGTEFGGYDSPIIPEDQFIPPPETINIYVKEKVRGIQGHHNSCYLDATLFAAFSFSSVLDFILLRPQDENDIKDYERVQTVLRNHIVYPLRTNGFVRADRVMELRQLLDRLGTVAGLMGEEKDPEEFLSTLLNQVLKSEPLLKIKFGSEIRHEYIYQVLADKDVERVLPSVEELLKKSFHQSGLKLTEIPSCLIVQMPRFGKQFKMYDRILPSLTINIGELVENSPQDCAVCGVLARFHCSECFTVNGSDQDSSGNFCNDCNIRVHSHIKRKEHKRQPLVVPREISPSYANKAIEHREMELFAVICINTSHYVTFVKCDEPNGVVRWCFFDSMADRIGTKEGYNIPSVTECPEITEWLSSEKKNRDRIINTSDKEMPDRVRRILGDAYVCLYQSKEIAMYR